MKKEKQCQLKKDKTKQMKLQMMYRADDETEDSFHCHICKKTFVNSNNFRAHKIKCWPTAKKHQCEKVKNTEKDLMQRASCSNIMISGTQRSRRGSFVKYERRVLSLGRC